MAEVEIKAENLVYQKPRLITDNDMHYCPGCSHGTVHKLVAEVIDEMGLEDKTMGVSPVGCSVFAYNYIAGSSDFSKISFNIRKFTVHVLLKPGLENFKHYFTSEMSTIVR